MSTIRSNRRKPVETIMITLFAMGIFACTIGLIAFEIYEEHRGSHDKLTDRYHD